MKNRERIILTRLVSGYILLFLALRFFLAVTPSGLLQPALSNGWMDISYWSLSAAGIFDLIVMHKATAVIFDIFLFTSGVLSFLFPLKRRFIIPFSLFVLLLEMIFNNYNLHHTETLAGFAIILIAFWPKDNEKSFLLWQAVRYFTCLIYPLSFFWKTVYGKAFYYWPQGAGSFKANLVEFIYMNPASFTGNVCRWFIQHDWILNSGTVMIHMMELLMLTGIFTKKFDRVLFWIPVVIHGSSYFFADVFYLELLVIDFSLLSMHQINRIGSRLHLSGPITKMQIQS